jgi:hypothetical protein
MSIIRQIVVLKEHHVQWLKAVQERDGVCMSETVRRSLTESMEQDPIKPVKKGKKRA